VFAHSFTYNHFIYCYLAEVFELGESTCVVPDFLAEAIPVIPRPHQMTLFHRTAIDAMLFVQGYDPDNGNKQLRGLGVAPDPFRGGRNSFECIENKPILRSGMFSHAAGHLFRSQARREDLEAANFDHSSFLLQKTTSASD
jgi:hypothetical protein